MNDDIKNKPEGTLNNLLYEFMSRADRLSELSRLVGKLRFASEQWEGFYDKAMIEEVEAVQNVDEIASVEGVDILHVAPGDLAQSMGNASVEEVRNVMDEVIPKIKASGKWSGVGGNSPSDINRILDLINLGANFVTVGANSILIKAAQGFKLQITERIEK